MSLSLGAKQELFAQCLADLITYSISRGYGVRLKEVLRDPMVCRYNATHCADCGKEATVHGTANHEFEAIGIEDSLHGESLAVDLVLTRNGIPLWTVEAYREVGEYWESLNPLAYWGGPTSKVADRLRKDGVHFSITHRGRQ